MKRLLKFLLLIVSLLSASCASYYKGPKESAGVAVIHNSGERGFYRFEQYIVFEIDGKPINYLWVGPDGRKFTLSPGTHRITLTASRLRGFGEQTETASEDFTLEAKPGKSYRVKGQFDGSRVELWIEDEQTGKAVTKRLRPGWTTVPRDPAPVIIMVPTG